MLDEYLSAVEMRSVRYKVGLGQLKDSQILQLAQQVCVGSLQRIAHAL
jgi:hypothetical protein